jgi:hypothetical protein
MFQRRIFTILGGLGLMLWLRDEGYEDGTVHK